MLRLENGDANKKQKKGIARLQLLIYSVHALCSASIRLRLYGCTWHIGTVSADTSMSCRFSSSAVSKKEALVFTLHTQPTRCPALPPAQLPCWRLQPSAWRLRGLGNKKSLCGIFSLWGKSVRRSNEKKRPSVVDGEAFCVADQSWRSCTAFTFSPIYSISIAI